MASWGTMSHCFLVLIVLVSFQDASGKSRLGLKRYKSELGKKRDSTNSNADSQAGVASRVNSKTGAATATDTKTESQTFTNTKVNTRIATSSNARSGANAAAKVKTYAHANTETRVNTEQESPHPPTTTPIPNKPSYPDSLPPGPYGSGNNGSCCNCSGNKCPPTIIKVYCPKCPCPCPPPCPCDCPCLKPKTTPRPTRPIPPTICLPPCVPLPGPCMTPPCNPQPMPMCMNPPCFDMLPPQMTYPMCPMNCPTPPCPCPLFKRSETLSAVNKTINKEIKKKSRKQKTLNAQKRVHAAGPPPDSQEEPLQFDHAAVAADNEICSKIGKEILLKNGTAADAIVSTHCCVEIVNSHSTGLGGGGFMVYYEKKTGKAKAYDFRESLVAAYTDTGSKTQGETILVPGVLRGLEAVHKDFGKLPWKDLWQPCIKLAREGFYIHAALAADKTQGDTILVPGVLKGLHKVWEDFGKLPWKDLWKPCIDLANKGFPIHTALNNAIQAKKDYILHNAALRSLYVRNNKVLKLGDILKRPTLAETYQRIADNGSSDIFYYGDIADQIAKDVQNAGGSMTKKDLEDYQLHVKKPLNTTLKGLIMLSTPPPGSGALISLALKIMEHFNWTANDQYKNKPLLYHRIVEAMKFAYAPYSFLSDPAFAGQNKTDQYTDYMLNDEVARRMFKRIDGVSHTVDYYAPFNKKKHPKKSGTSHISIIDRYGNAVGGTTSINAYFGSKLLSQKLGFIYNNELADFSEFWPDVYNLNSDKKIPGKRPMSKSSPIIFLDKHYSAVGVFGAAGGFFIPSCLIQTIANWLFFHNNIKIAVSKPRVHCQLFPPTVVYEPTFPAEIIPGLESYSHAYVTNSTYDVSGQLNAIMGVVQAVVRLPNGKLNAESDYRKGGKPAELFAPDGTILQLGDKLARPKLARTYEQIANEGADVFYLGKMANQIVEDIRAAGGYMTREDLASYKVREVEPIRTNINEFTVLTTPAPSSGALMSLALKILAEGKWNAKKFAEKPDRYFHEYIESMKLASAPSTFLSDPRFNNNTKQVEEYMLSDSTAKNMYKKIDGFSHNVEDYKPYSQLFSTEKTGTSHMSVLDQNGNACSLTSSINAYFGSKLRSRELDFIYNNELADFSEFWPKIYNLTSDAKIPGKRPMSRVMPSIFLKGNNVEAVWGAAGGFFIPAAITMSIANWMFLQDNLKVAITRPRLHCQLFPPTVVYEPTLPKQMVPKIESFSHQYVTNSTYDVSGQLNAIMGVVQAIARTKDGKISAECDYRKGGRPAGF